MVDKCVTFNSASLQEEGQFCVIIHYLSVSQLFENAFCPENFKNDEFRVL